MDPRQARSRRVMFEEVDYHGVRRLVEEGAQLLEVLPADDYAEEHLPGATNIPLKQLDADFGRGDAAGAA